jgi:hypothetical protein
MSPGREAYDAIVREIGNSAPGTDPRHVRSLAWAVTGAVLEQDARLARQALVFESPDLMAGRVRRIERLLDGSLDHRSLYAAVLRSHLHRWNGLTAWLVLDTCAIRRTCWFVRLGLCYRRRSIPVAWRAYPGDSPMVGFDVYREVLETADGVLPSCVRRCLLADRGFSHAELFGWCLDRGWSFRIGPKRDTLITLPHRDTKPVERFRRRSGSLRAIHTAFVGRGLVGPVGLVLSWPLFHSEPTLHVISDDAPGLFTVPDMLRRPGIEEAFRDDKGGGFHLESVRMTSPARVDRLLLVMALAYLFLFTAGDGVVRRGERNVIEPGAGYLLSRFQLGCRYVHRAVWRGDPLHLELRLEPDPAPPDRAAAERSARREHHRIGLVPGRVWMPFRSFESENACWWLPGRVLPRLPDGIWR